MLSRKIRFKNGSWVILIQANGRICEVYSSGLTQFRQDERTMSEIAEELTKKLEPSRGEVTHNEDTVG